MGEPRTAATVKIRNLIVAIHEGDEEVTVSVWPDHEVEEAIETVSVRYDAVYEAPCGVKFMVTEEPCRGNEDEECEGCRMLDADISNRVSPYDKVLPCGKLSAKNCVGDKKKWTLCESCPARIHFEVLEDGTSRARLD